jgi:hypothetical protein
MAEGEPTVIKSWPQILRERRDIDKGPFFKANALALGGGAAALTVLGLALKATGVAALVTAGSGILAALAVGAGVYAVIMLARHALRIRRHYKESLDTIETDMREPGMRRVN